MDEMKVKKISELEEIDEAPEGATLLAYADGALKRLKAGNVGGGKRAVFKVDMGSDVSTANLMSGVMVAASDSQTYSATCDTITFEEAKNALLTGEYVGVGAIMHAGGMCVSADGGVLMYTSSDAAGLRASAPQEVINGFVSLADAVIIITWTADGITVQMGA